MNSQVEALARDFSKTLIEWLGPETMREVVRLNASYVGTEFEGCCASHNFCDANMAMNSAFLDIVGKEFHEDSANPELEEQREAECELWNSAWDLAQKNNFWME
jgi:hypothetical protein